MGGGISKFQGYQSQPLIDVVKCRPDYYVDVTVLRTAEIDDVRRQWTQILKGLVNSVFLMKKVKRVDGLDYDSSVEWFLDLYSCRVFDLCPELEIIFNKDSLFTPGSVIQNLISSSMSVLHDSDKMRETLLDQIKNNYVKGIKGEMYGCMGTALFWALEMVIGSSFSTHMKKSWIRVYSLILNVVLPLHAECELTVQNRPGIASKTPSEKILSGSMQSFRKIVSSENLGRICRFISSSIDGSETDSSIKSILNEAKPRYYIENVSIKEEDVNIAKTMWMIIMSGSITTPYLKKKEKDPDFPYSSTLTWFYDLFYNRLFEVCPNAKPIFINSSMVTNSKLIACLISSALNAFKDKDHIKSKIAHCASDNAKRGLKAEYYGDMGLALFWALEQVIGDPFDSLAKQAWIKLYSHLLNLDAYRNRENKSNGHRSLIEGSTSTCSGSASSTPHKLLKMPSLKKMPSLNRIPSKLTIVSEDEVISPRPAIDHDHDDINIDVDDIMRPSPLNRSNPIGFQRPPVAYNHGRINFKHN
eukprot:gene11483-24012_t